MEFKLSALNKKANKSVENRGHKTVCVSQSTVEQIIDLLSNVECTCVWSERDNEYIKVNDIPQNIVKELEMMLKMTNFAQG